MPSGYTKDIYDGTPVTFREFALKVANYAYRRDPIENFLPKSSSIDSYYADNLEHAKIALKIIETLSSRQAAIDSQKLYDAQMQEYNKEVEKMNKVKERYETMIAEVSAWQVPSSNHVTFKELTLNILNESMEIDIYIPTPPLLKSPEEWRTRKLEMAKDDVEYHEKKYELATKQNIVNNLWATQLYNSLPNY